MYSRRINIQHRLVYQVIEGRGTVMGDIEEAPLAAAVALNTPV